MIASAEQLNPELQTLVWKTDLSRDHDATLVASTEPWETALALGPAEALDAEYERRDRLLAVADPRARDGIAAELVLAADQFIVSPAGRLEATAWARAVGDEFCSVIAGYHWFLDWGRDTMISLEGLTLVTGRHTEAGFILRMFARYLRDGLLPNTFPEGRKEGLYHTADATLWFFHALRRYLDYTGDRLILRHCSRSCSMWSSTICAARALTFESIPRTAFSARERKDVSLRGWTQRSATGS